MRKALAASLLAVLPLLAPAPRAAEAADPAGTRWEGILPDPHPRVDARWFACRVLDARTREPVEGARWIRTPEWIAPWRLRHDTVLGVATTDADGIAHLPTTPTAWPHDCHWLVRAEGYGFDHDYGAVPPTEVLLKPEAHIQGRVLDALGRPVAGALVEVLGGCSHGLAAASVTAGPDGTFAIDGVDPDLGGQFWVAGTGIASDLLALDDPPSLGTRGVVLAMEPGVTYRGRVVDLLDRPLPNTVIRAYNEQRGPATDTDRHGRFVLEGVEPGSGFVVFPAADLTEGDETFWVDDVYPDAPITLVVTPLGVVEEEPSATVRIRARDAEGRPATSLPYRLESAATGRGPSGYTAEPDEDDPDAVPGEGVEEVPAGTWRVVPEGDPFLDDAFAAHTFDPVTVRVGAGGEATVDLVVRPQARLRIEGEVPPNAELRLAIEGAAVDPGETEEPTWLPSDGPAALRVEAPGRPPFFFPVGPPAAGVRTVTVRLPEPRVVVLPRRAKDAALWDGERDVYAVLGPDGGTLLTDASGRVVLRWTVPDGTKREAPIEIPDRAGARVEVVPTTVRVVGERTTVTWRDPDGAVYFQETSWPGHWAEVPREGWRTLRTRVPEEEPAEARWGACTLRLSVRDEDGPVDALVLLAGDVYAAPHGTLALRGLDAGPLRVVVAYRDRLGGGRAYHLDLETGETRSLEAVLGSPP